MINSGSKLFAAMDRKYSILLFCIVLLSFFLRLASIYLFPVNYSNVIEEHGKFAENIYHGFGLRLDEKLPPSALRTPLYPYWLAFVYFISGLDYKVALLGQFLLDSVTTIFVFLLGKLLFNNAKIGLFASFLWSIYLPEFIYIRRLYAENMASTLLIIHMYFIVRALKEQMVKRKIFDYALSGIFLGLASLCRAEYHLFPLFLLILFILPSWKGYRKQFLKGYGIMIFSFILVLSPWIIRNYSIFGALIPGTTDVGHILVWDGIGGLQEFSDANPEIVKIYEEGMKIGSEQYQGAYLIHPDYSEAELSRLMTIEGLRLIIKHPFKFFQRVFRRLLHSWFNYLGWWNRPFTVKDFLFVFVNLVFLVSIMYSHWRYSEKWQFYTYPLLLIILYKTILHSLLVATPRYFLPIWPYFMIYFSFVFFQLSSRIRSILLENNR
tara:strand:- start:8944 stop:10254 length:1311 start_codon:yes stop_codon:yes gene_type:complete